MKATTSIVLFLGCLAACTSPGEEFLRAVKKAEKDHGLLHEILIFQHVQFIGKNPIKRTEKGAEITLSIDESTARTAKNGRYGVMGLTELEIQRCGEAARYDLEKNVSCAATTYINLGVDNQEQRYLRRLESAFSLPTYAIDMVAWRDTCLAQTAQSKRCSLPPMPDGLVRSTPAEQNIEAQIVCIGEECHK